MCGMFDDGGWPAYAFKELDPEAPQESVTATPSKCDEFVAMKMLEAFKNLRWAQPNKSVPDITEMLSILTAAKQAYQEFAKSNTADKKVRKRTQAEIKERADKMFFEATQANEGFEDPHHLRTWADALAKDM